MKKRMMTVISMVLLVVMMPAVSAAGTVRGTGESGIAALYITSADPVNEGREWVEASPDKSNKAKGSYEMKDAGGNVIFSGKLRQIKGRGNTTWATMPKKPYQIKLSVDEDLLETGVESEKSKTWVLLANYGDETLLRNQITFAIAREIGLAFTPESRQVDLYYDGEYRGVYQLCEKVEVAPGRVDINNLGKQIETANSGVDLDTLPVAQGTADGGIACQYVDGVKLPESIDGGYLIEMEYRATGEQEKTWFRTTHGQTMSLKSPEYLPLDGVNVIAGLYQEFEDAVYNGGVSPKTGRRLSEIADMDSLAKVYLIEELSEDFDAYGSSNYFYKPEGENKLYAGPVWDFDAAYVKENSPEGLGAGRSELGKHLLEVPEFQAAVKKVCSETFYGAVKDVADTQLMAYGDAMRASAEKNSVLWPKSTHGDAKAEQEALREFILARNEFLLEETGSWDGSPVRNGQFFDVHARDWFYEDVKYAGENGLFAGVMPGYFKPYSAMSRAMIVTVLYRSAGSPAVSKEQIFEDVTPGIWYADAVAWAYAEDVTKGVSANAFAPDMGITRQDFVTLLYRMEGSPEMDTECLSEFADRSDVAAYAEEAMAWAIGEGLVIGDQQKRLTPRASLTRAQAAAILHRAAE